MRPCCDACHAQVAEEEPTALQLRELLAGVRRLGQCRHALRQLQFHGNVCVLAKVDARAGRLAELAPVGLLIALKVGLEVRAAVHAKPLAAAATTAAAHAAAAAAHGRNAKATHVAAAAAAAAAAVAALAAAATEAAAEAAAALLPATVATTPTVLVATPATTATKPATAATHAHVAEAAVAGLEVREAARSAAGGAAARALLLPKVRRNVAHLCCRRLLFRS